MNTTHEPNRDRWGRYLLPDPTTGEERAWTRVTTVSGILSDRFNLERWGERMVAHGLAQRPDLVMLAARVKDPKGFAGKKTLNRVAKDAKDAASAGSAANIGTAIHAASEELDLGGDPQLPAPYDKDLAAYAALQKRHGLRTLVDDSGPWVERIVLCPALGLAGTLDRVMTAKGADLPRVADLKTGATVHFSHLEHSIQQSIYANASHYYDASRDELVEMPAIDKDVAYIIHVPAGKGEAQLYELNIAAGFEAAAIAADVHGRWRKRDDLSREVTTEVE